MNIWPVEGVEDTKLRFSALLDACITDAAHRRYFNVA